MGASSWSNVVEAYIYGTAKRGWGGYLSGLMLSKMAQQIHCLCGQNCGHFLEFTLKPLQGGAEGFAESQGGPLVRGLSGPTLEAHCGRLPLQREHRLH